MWTILSQAIAKKSLETPNFCLRNIFIFHQALSYINSYVNFKKIIVSKNSWKQALILDTRIVKRKGTNDMYIEIHKNISSAA